LQEFLALRDLVPDEVNIQFMLGKLFKVTGNRAQAMKYFVNCLNLDAKAGHLIKESIERLDEPEDDLLAFWGEVYKNMDED
jgi:anaphase-promoting complex subunit 3